VSHGCIRIESPLKFAEYLISDDEKLHMDEIRLGLGLKPEDKEDEKNFKKRMEYYKENKDSADFGTETKTIMLKKKIPVYVDYYTAWVDSNGVLNFRMDVYERDKKILGKIR
jgi:murein L,D-transpeptidase YcbB/YkuD